MASRHCGGVVGLEPLLLRRARARGDVGAVAVQHDDVPGAQIVAVVALGGVARRGAEIAEVAVRRGARHVVLLPGPTSVTVATGVAALCAAGPSGEAGARWSSSTQATEMHTTTAARVSLSDMSPSPDR